MSKYIHDIAFPVNRNDFEAHSSEQACGQKRIFKVNLKGHQFTTLVMRVPGHCPVNVTHLQLLLKIKSIQIKIKGGVSVLTVPLTGYCTISDYTISKIPLGYFYP